MFIQPEAAHEIMGRLGEKGCCQFEDNMLEKWEDDILQMGAYQTQLLKNQKDLQEMHYVFKSLDPLLGDAELRRESLFVKSAGGEPMLGGKVHIETGVVRRSKSYAFETMLWRVSRGNIYFRTVQQDELFEDPQTRRDVSAAHAQASCNRPAPASRRADANTTTFERRYGESLVQGAMIREVAFVAVCQGDRLKGLLQKVCNGFHAHTFPCPRTMGERRDMLGKLDSRIHDLAQVIRKSRYHRCKQFRTIGKYWETWMAQVKKSKAIYHRLNEFTLDITRKCLIGQCWMPTRDMKSVHEIFNQGSSKSGSKVASFMMKLPTIEPPPTYHRTNKFTRGFQALISAYGDSAYRELNPGLYTLITFPFLFAVMFGDCGHGSIMLSFALWMVCNERKYLATRSTNEIWNIFFGGRYVILIMSMFTMYTGFIYNDWFSKPLRLKNNFWINQFTAEEIGNDEILALDPAGKTKEWYLLGVDPVWAEKLHTYLGSRKEPAGEHTDKMEEVLTQQVHHYSESFSELMIHQGVHTIEYVLSTISHTASYLRLWALSLAHAQLSEMLWGMVLSKLALQDHSRIGAIKIFVIFAIWASFSLSILVVMEGLSAFLHTLRLHWVEFMSKFYIGSGSVFHPFSFKEIVYGESKEDKGIAEGACKKRKRTY
ncbi:V-type proton ATPase 116 kDa subunit a 4-like [Pectinophora gossypiella]|uniref:V-type proton ATPase 116 kDa subunit a 4-like n=1 Tax=Pectinophora gossypiella TaxID=13191 RepID=UPI00214F0719|nr:V-type proton ATPase 116 kDa subunit a 4-like [Pectinophora gossypiella]